VAALVLALRRRREDGAAAPSLAAPSPAAARIVAGLVAATALTVIGLTLLSFVTGKGIARIQGEETLAIRVIGHQWWWEIRYDDPVPARTLTTANEIHVPVGTPVRLDLESTDVIHSFWIPNVTGKQDLIPGWRNRLSILVERPGLYAGQCAEFCGLQHAHMGLLLVAHSPDDYARWFEAQLEPAAEPAGALARKGRDVFVSTGCILCHAIRGTAAAAKTGPDLTHVASRRFIAAGILPTSRESLAAWIADPQAIKPGNNMPRVDLTPDALEAVAAYLAELE
jgi:cytochrome c oxidase subunit 2